MTHIIRTMRVYVAISCFIKRARRAADGRRDGPCDEECMKTEWGQKRVPETETRERKRGQIKAVFLLLCCSWFRAAGGCAMRAASSLAVVLWLWCRSGRFTVPPWAVQSICRAGCTIRPCRQERGKFLIRQYHTCSLTCSWVFILFNLFIFCCLQFIPLLSAPLFLLSSRRPLLNFHMLKSFFFLFFFFSLHQKNFLSSKDKCTVHFKNFILSQTVCSTAEVGAFVIKLLGVCD